MKSNTPTFKDLDERHMRLIQLFEDSIKEQISPDTTSAITFEYVTHANGKKELYSILFNGKIISLAQLYNTKKKTLNKKQIEFEKNLTDIGKDIVRQFHTHMIDWNTQRDIMWNKLNTLYEETKRKNAKYFILTQMAGDE